MTDDERMKEYFACVQANAEPMNRNGLMFIGYVLMQQYAKATGKWLEMITADQSGAKCLDILTPEQREKVRQWAREDRDAKRLAPKLKNL